MTDILLFQLFGLIFLSVGAGMFINAKYCHKMIGALMSNRPLIFIIGILATTLGFLIVSIHNVWAFEWSVLITIFGWASLLKGIIILAFPTMFSEIAFVMRLNE